MTTLSKALVWFRNDLRVTDNQSLTKAIACSKPVIAAYFFDPRVFQEKNFGFRKTEKFRAQFIIQTLNNLKLDLEKLNIPLLIYIDYPEKVLPELIKNQNIDHVFLQKEWTSEEEVVLNKVKKHCTNKTQFTESFDQFLFHPEDIPFTIEDIPQIFSNFRRKCEKYSSVREVLPIPSPLKQESLLSNLSKHCNVPTLQDLNYETVKLDSRTAFPFHGGEKTALNRLNQYFFDTKKLAVYKKTRNGLVGSDYSSKFSPWLANGSLSPRTIYWQIKDFEASHVKNESTYWLIFELIWRDFFKYISLKFGNHIFKLGGILQRSYDWGSNKALIKKWVNGVTYEPFVNANMLELKHTGWMSNRGRQNVASYFAKELKLDWRIGAAYFESMLLDYDVHSNYGNWMYVAGVGNDPRDRKFNVRLQAERYDAKGKFQNLWLQQSLFA